MHRRKLQLRRCTFCLCRVARLLSWLLQQWPVTELSQGGSAQLLRPHSPPNRVQKSKYDDKQPGPGFDRRIVRRLFLKPAVPPDHLPGSDPSTAKEPQQPGCFSQEAQRIGVRRRVRGAKLGTSAITPGK